ncbi:MAG TPA: efflux RND transporter periplasmic adaptor subunit [Phycisphaerae bacterium]|nr:efflux RND transporter periplasmic adaptor subunit [Phycisphaerae bacterium]
MKKKRKYLWTTLGIVLALLVIGLWLIYFHNAAVASMLPRWNWLQKGLAAMGPPPPPAEADDEDADTSQNTIPVHAGRITVATLHRYIEAYGTVAPRPAAPGQPAGSANIASPVAGVVSKILHGIGDKIHAGDPLIQLDDRLAAATEVQAQATLQQEQDALATLKASPRPSQLQIAQLGIDKAKSAVDFAQQNYDRLKTLAAQQGASAKSVEQAAQDLTSARNDLQVAQRQLELLTPTATDIALQQAKVAQAQAALDAAKVQRQMLTVTAPMDGTVVALNVNPGESVDPTRTLIQLIAMDRLMVDIDVPADQLPANAVGLPAEILRASPAGAAASQPATSSADPAASPVMGSVSFIAPQVDPRNGAVMVGINLPPDANMLPGLSVHVRIVAETHKDRLAVPQDAVSTDENGDSVIALLEPGEGPFRQAIHKTVKTGLQENGLTEISADDLKEGDEVVTVGAFGLPQATRVKVVE